MPFRHDVTSFREILLLWSNSFGSFFTCCVSSFFVTLKLAPIPSNKGSSHVMVTSQIALCNSTVATSSWNWYDTYNHEFVRKVLCFFFKNSLRVTIAKVFSLRILLFSDQISRSIVYHLTTSLLQNIFCFMEQRRLQIVFSAEFSVEISLFIKTLFAFSKKLVEIYVTTAPWNSSSRRNRIEILFTRGVL